MADINVTFTPVTGSSDIDSYEVYVCDATSNGHFTDAASLQTKLDAIHGGATVGSQGLVKVETIANLGATSITSPYTAPGSGSYHFGVAAKNQGGFKVEDDTAVTQLIVS
jgi:hypothetical protein